MTQQHTDSTHNLVVCLIHIPYYILRYSSSCSWTVDLGRGGMISLGTDLNSTPPGKTSGLARSARDGGSVLEDRWIW
jgi:hypothetical protein